MPRLFKIGDTEIEMVSYESGKCVDFINGRCKTRSKKTREKQKALSKKERCDGRDLDCKLFIGSSIYAPQYDEGYLLPPSESEILTLALGHADNVLIFGPPGVGKSSLVNQLACIFNWGVERYSCSEETSSSKIIGQWVVIGDTMEWVDGHITHAMKEGLILLEDEVDFMRPELRGEIHSLMEQGGSINLTAVHPQTRRPFRENVKKHKNFRWISTANTLGYGDDLFAFHGTQYLNAASRDRYEIIIRMGYKEPDEEVAIMERKTGIKLATARQMVEVANECRKSVKDGMIFQFSLRRLLSWAKYSQKMPDKIACELAVLNFANDTDRHTIKSLIRTIMDIEIEE